MRTNVLDDIKELLLILRGVIMVWRLRRKMISFIGNADLQIAGSSVMCLHFKMSK